MLTIHATLLGDKALIPREEFDRLLDLAGQAEHVEVVKASDDLPAAALAKLAEDGGSFDWLADEPDLYTIDDLKVRYR